MAERANEPARSVDAAQGPAKIELPPVSRTIPGPNSRGQSEIENRVHFVVVGVPAREPLTGRREETSASTHRVPPCRARLSI